MKRVSIILSVGILAACQPPAQQTKSDVAQAQIPAQVSGGCNMQASRDWSAVGSQYYVIEAETRGETCRDAVAAIRIETTDGRAVFTREYATAQIPLAFNPNSDRTGVRNELEAWIANTSETQRADELPAWPLRAERPPGFQPAVTRGQYEAARGAQGPLFCYPDGGESNACIALAGANATLLGSLTPERP
jgi:hypothetical protein